MPIRILNALFTALAVLAPITSFTFAAESENENTTEQITRSIALLGDSDFSVREEATEKLETYGEQALPALRTALAESKDLEVHYRLRGIIAKVMANACQSRSTGMRLVFLEPREFSMGSPPNESGRMKNETAHAVKVTSPFLIGAYEVTQGEYRQVVDEAPSWFSKTGEGKEKVGKEDTARFPVDSVSWFDAIAFCNRLSERDSLPLYYELTGIKHKGESIVEASVKVVGGIGYRLPTEAEWEYACRAGTNTAYQFGESRSAKGNFQIMGATIYGSRAKVRSLGRTTTVGSYTSNLWGLHDMHGNVAEWCWDWYDEAYYGRSPLEDPSGPTKGHHRILRGGSWLVKQANCRCAARFWQIPSEGKYFTGFRVARNPSEYMLEP